MNKLASSVFMAGLIFFGTQAFADDMQKDHMMKDQMMKDCMSKMAAKNDGSTKEQMTAACKAEMKNSMGKDDKMASPKNP